MALARNGVPVDVLAVELELVGEDAGRGDPGPRAHLDGCPACGEERDNLHARVGGEQAP